jgi:hypothetical protein
MCVNGDVSPSPRAPASAPQRGSGKVKPHIDHVTRSPMPSPQTPQETLDRQQAKADVIFASFDRCTTCTPKPPLCARHHARL